jgi:hypothetical protein
LRRLRAAIFFFFKRYDEMIEVITVNNASCRKCSMSVVDLCLISKRSGGKQTP